MKQVAALYVSPKGPYPSLAGVDCWDEQRDAKLYRGPYPVVAHPPCGPWGRLRHMCTKQDPQCAIRAVRQVRKWGGVLEHPQGSLLFRELDMPGPGGPCDKYGGSTYAIRQVDWGHACVKPTWLYVVGVGRQRVLETLRPREGAGVATHCNTCRPHRSGSGC